jgi:alpha-1,2-mannosyltransferase
MIGQSLGSIVLAYEAISCFVPDIFIDTMGYAFTLPFVSSVLEIPTAAYVHYPTISTDMLSRLPGTSIAKHLYWRLFALGYGYVCRQMDLLMTNSSWTKNHMEYLTGKEAGKGQIRVVFPPCDTEALTKLPLSPREKAIIYVAQFRPEKDHLTVLKAFSILLSNHPEMRNDGVKLVLIGSTRDDRDRQKVDSLRSEAVNLDIEGHVEFVCDAPWKTVVEWLGRGWIGTNAMWNEHFGIGVVEYMAAGLIPVVHNSGGPKEDIVVPFNGRLTGNWSLRITDAGFHATTPAEFAEGYAKAFSLPETECMAIRQRARKSAGRFSEEVFMTAWTEEMQKLLKAEQRYRGERIYRTRGT